MDEIDRMILNILQMNNKTPFHKIAKQLKIGSSTVHYRIQKMVENGVIENFSAIVNPEKIGYKMTAIVGLSVDQRKIDKIAKKIASFEEAQVVAETSGDHDLIVQVISKSQEDLWRFIKKNIITINGVGKNYDVSIFLDVVKRTHIIEL